jgi:hypothetical protein
MFMYGQLTHRAATLTAGEIRSALAHTDLDKMWQRDLTPLLVTRYPGTAGSLAVQQVSAQGFYHAKSS